MPSVSIETAPVQSESRPGDIYAWLITQAYEIRRRGHPWSEYLARQIEELAGNVSFTRSCTPEDLSDRLAVLEQNRVEDAVRLARMRDMTYGDHRGGRYP